MQLLIQNCQKNSKIKDISDELSENKKKQERKLTNKCVLKEF